MEAQAGSLCAQCKHAPSKYTCPRCATKTCSLTCSRAHKAETSCSGERNKAAYIPMNEYGYGKLMDDYSYLEATRRKADEWKKDIEEQKMDRTVVDGGGRGVARGRGGHRGGGTHAFGEGSNKIRKMQAIQEELARRGIEVEFLPEGMQRRMKNQSTFNTKSKLLQLSVELSVYPEATESNSETPASSFQVPVERFIPRLPLQPTTTLRSILSEVKVSPPPDRTSNEDTVFVMPIQLSSHINLNILPRNRSRPSKPYYPPLAGDASLESQLAGKGFIEFPTFEVFTHSEWERYLTDSLAVVAHVKSDDEESDDGLGDGKRLRDSGWGSRANGAKRVKVNEEEELGGVVVQHEEQPLVVAASDHHQAMPNKLQNILGDYDSHSDEEE